METVNFYYNTHINICAEESWVVDFLIENEECEDEEEALEVFADAENFMVG